MEGTLVLLAVVLIFLIALARRSWNKSSSFRTTNIPEVTGWPLIGNLNYFIGVNNTQSALKAFTKLATAHESPLITAWLGLKMGVIVKSPKYIESLLTHRAAGSKDDFFYKGFKEAVGDGVFVRKGQAWQQLRKPMMHFVQPKNIKDFQNIITRKVGSLCAELDKRTDNGTFDIAPHIKLCSLDLIIGAVLGIDNIGMPMEAKLQAIHHLDEELETFFTELWTVVSILGLKKFKLNSNREKHFNKILNEITKKRKAQIEALGMNLMTDAPQNYTDVLLSIAEHEKLSDREVALLLRDITVAGTDTQSVVMIVLLILLAMHPEYQENVYQELVSIFGDSNRSPEEKDLKRMVYLDMCIKEALRHCSAPIVGRLAEEDINIDGFRIPKGAGLLYPLYLMLNNPKYWERPDDFFPDHFLPEAVAQRPKGTYLPFVAGPRMCPGQLYSYQAMKTILSTLLRTYYFTTDQKYSELEYKYLLMREPLNTYVKITKRPPTGQITNQMHHRHTTSSVL